MFDRLPIELALAIFRHAAEICVVSDRASAVWLAQTSRLVYATTRPILLRRVTATDENQTVVEDLLQHSDSAAFILDLTLTARNWDPSKLPHMTRLRCLRGITGHVDLTISFMLQSTLKQLYKVQLWNYGPLKVMPPNVSHLCLCAKGMQQLDIRQFVASVTGTPSITHFGIELISRDDWDIRVAVTPSMLVDGLRAIFEAGGTHLCEISVRLSGHLALPENWTDYLRAFRTVGEEETWVSKTRLWRDSRHFVTADDDVNACIADALAGVDIWSEACPLEMLL